jgi:hypothetical protein
MNDANRTARLYVSGGVVAVLAVLAGLALYRGSEPIALAIVGMLGLAVQNAMNQFSTEAAAAHAKAADAKAGAAATNAARAADVVQTLTAEGGDAK